MHEDTFEDQCLENDFKAQVQYSSKENSYYSQGKQKISDRASLTVYRKEGQQTSANLLNVLKANKNCKNSPVSLKIHSLSTDKPQLP